MKKRIASLFITVLLLVTMLFTGAFFTGCSQRPESLFEMAVRLGLFEEGQELAFLEYMRGANAFEIARANGFDGTLEEWLAHLGGGDVSIDDLFNLFLIHRPNATYEDFIAAFMPTGNGDPYQAAIQNMMRSAVSIQATFEMGGLLGGTRTGAGAGVIYRLDRSTGVAYIITNYHVIYEHSARDRHSNQIRVAPFGREYFGSGSGFRPIHAINAVFIGGSASRDIAVIRTVPNQELQRDFFREIEVANSNDIIVGQTVFAVGNPDGVGTSVTRGIINVDSEYISISTIDAASGFTTHRVMRTDAPINPGNSGGGLFNAQGKLVGIVNAKSVAEHIDNMGYAIPSNVALGVIRAILRQRDNNQFLQNNGQFVKAIIGIYSGVHASWAELVDGVVRIRETVQVRSIANTQSAAHGHLQEYDFLISARLGDRDRVYINRNHILNDELYYAEPGMQLAVIVRRDMMYVEVVFTILDGAHGQRRI